MLKLAMPVDAYWIDLPFGVRVKVRPLNTAVYEAARSKGQRLTMELLRDHTEITRAGGSVEGLPDLGDEDAVVGLSQLLFTQALGLVSIIEWEGVLDDTDNPAAVTEDTVSELMRFHSVAEEFLVKYTKAQIDLVSEGNGSWPAPNGTSAAGQTIAPDAGKAA